MRPLVRLVLDDDHTSRSDPEPPHAHLRGWRAPSRRGGRRGGRTGDRGRAARGRAAHCRRSLKLLCLAKQFVDLNNIARILLCDGRVPLRVQTCVRLVKHTALRGGQSNTNNPEILNPLVLGWLTTRLHPQCTNVFAFCPLRPVVFHCRQGVLRCPLQHVLIRGPNILLDGHHLSQEKAVATALVRCGTPAGRILLTHPELSCPPPPMPLL